MITEAEETVQDVCLELFIVPTSVSSSGKWVDDYSGTHLIELGR